MEDYTRWKILSDFQKLKSEIEILPDILDAIIKYSEECQYKKISALSSITNTVLNLHIKEYNKLYSILESELKTAVDLEKEPLPWTVQN